MIRKILPAILAVLSAQVCAATCIPTDVSGVPSPLIAGVGKLLLSAGGTINGSRIIVSGRTSLPITGTTSALSAGALPRLAQGTFPMVGASELNTEGPVSAGSYGSVVTSGSPTLFLGGDYYINSLYVNGPIQLAAGNYFINNLYLHSDLTVTGQVQLFIGNQMTVVNDGISINAGGNAGNLQVSLRDGARFEAKGNISFTGLLYSPHSSSAIKFADNTSIAGAAITSGELQFDGDASVIFDSTVQEQIATLTCPVSEGPDHYELSLPTNSISCLPTSAVIVACADYSSPCANPYTAASGTSVDLLASGGKLGAATVTFNSGGIATTSLNYPAAVDGTAVSVHINAVQLGAANPDKCCPNGANCIRASTCSTTYNTAGFIISATATGFSDIPTQVAGTLSRINYLRAVKTNTITAACEAALTGTQSVGIGYECNNPKDCHASNLMSVDGGTMTTIQRNNLSNVVNFTPVDMNFDANGSARFRFNYSDVGRVALHVNRSAGVSSMSSLRGISNPFVVKPAGFVLSGIRQTAEPHLTNPAASNTSGATFVRVGESFSATVTAVTSFGSPAYNYGRETLAEDVHLESVLVAGPEIRDNHAVSGTFGSFENGSANGTAFFWDKVGIIKLMPSVGDGDYLGTGDIVGDVSGAPSVNVGRFY